MHGRMLACMVAFVSWQEAQARVREEPVMFAEVVSDAPSDQQLEIHIMYQTSKGLHEAEREDTGRISKEDVLDVLTRIAASRRVRYAAIRRAEDYWPPEWVRRSAPDQSTAGRQKI